MLSFVARRLALKRLASQSEDGWPNMDSLNLKAAARQDVFSAQEEVQSRPETGQESAAVKTKSSRHGEGNNRNQFYTTLLSLRITSISTL